MRRPLIAIIFSLFAALAALADGAVPRPSPEYAFKLPSGQQILLSQHRGKVVALMFIATTCPHCQKTCQLLDKLHQEYGPRGFQPLAVAFNEMAVMLLPDFVKQGRLNLPVGYDHRDPVFAYLERSPMLRTYVPITVFVDRTGTIRGQYLGDDKFYANEERNFRAMIEKLLAEPASKSRARK